MLKSVVKWERVEVIIAFASACIELEVLVAFLFEVRLKQIVLEVLYVATSSFPSIFVLQWVPHVVWEVASELSQTKHKRLHARLVQTVRFWQVQYVELNRRWFVAWVRHFEVVPLSVSLRIEVVVEPQIVLNVVDFAGFV